MKGSGTNTNESGFSGLPGGRRCDDGMFDNIDTFGSWWISSEANTTNAWYYLLNYYDGRVDRSDYDKKYGFSVRCLRD